MLSIRWVRFPSAAKWNPGAPLRSWALLQLRGCLLALGAVSFISSSALAQEHAAHVDDSPTSKALSQIKRKPGERPVVAIYEVRSGVPGIQSNAAQEMFMTALIKSGAFAVAERTRLSEGVGRERQLMAGGQATGDANKSQVAGAQYVFEVVISEFNSAANARNNSVSIEGAQVGVAGGDSQIGMDIRITDVSTGLVVDSVNVTEQVSSSQTQVSGLKNLSDSIFSRLGKSAPVSADASVQTAHNDGVDRALRSCIEAGVAELARRFNAD